MQMNPIPPDFLLASATANTAPDASQGDIGYTSEGAQRKQHEAEFYENAQDNDHVEAPKPRMSLLSADQQQRQATISPSSIGEDSAEATEATPMDM